MITSSWSRREGGLGSTAAEVATIVSLRHRHEAIDAETRERMAELRRTVTDLLNPKALDVGRPTKTEPENNVDNINISRKGMKGGTDPGSVLSRLKRDNPALAKRVLAGELSAHAAAIEAGFGRKTITVPHDPVRAAKALRRHFDRDEIKLLISGLLE